MASSEAWAVGLIAAPLLVFALWMSLMTRQDSEMVRAIKQAERHPANRFLALAGTLGIPIAIVALVNNLFGAVVLLVSGLGYLFQERLFPDVFWIRGAAARLVGVAHLAIRTVLLVLRLP